MTVQLYDPSIWMHNDLSFVRKRMVSGATLLRALVSSAKQPGLRGRMMVV